MKRKHKVLSWWATLILTFVGMLSIVGVTVLVMYLSGQFNEKIVWPQDMEFSHEVDGMGFFDENGDVYIASDFKLTLSTTTEDVTKDKVSLFLDGDKNKTSNGVISVPKEVRLNKPFQITLEKDEQGFAKGGMATITAVSEDETRERRSITVYVDKPAQGIDVKLAQTEGNSVVIGSTFNIETTFTPQESKYAFSKDNEEKLVFFSSTLGHIDYDWTNKNFYTKSQSGEEYDEIKVYAFANANFQKETLEKFLENPEQFSPEELKGSEELNSEVTTYLQTVKESEETYWEKTIRVYVTDSAVTIVTMEKDEKTIRGTLDKNFVLTTNSDAQDENSDALGISIKENDKSPSLDGLLGNVGIRINKGDTGLRIDNRRMDRPDVVGKVLKVVENADGEEKSYDISVEENFDYSKYDEYVNASEGTEYYVLPSTSTKFTKDYYWQLAAWDTQERTLFVNFFYIDTNGSYVNFFDFSGDDNPEKTFTYVAEAHQNVPATWENKNRIQLEVTFDDEGKAENAQVELSDFVNEIPSDNVYQKTKFFLFMSGDLENVNVQNIFNVKEGVTYTENYLGEKLNIWGQSNENGYVLYELETDDLLIAKQKLPSRAEAYVLIAILKTDVDGNVSTTVENGVTKYQIVNLSDPKEVKVESSLSIQRMAPSFSFTTKDEIATEGGRLFVPAVNHDKMIKFVLKYECADDDAESWDADYRKISDAFDSGAIQIVCADSQQQEYDDQYVSLNGKPTEEFSSTGKREKTLYFSGEIVIKEELFASSNSGNKVTSKDIYLLLKYDNGHDLFKKNVVGEDNQTTEDDHFVVYYQTPKELKADYLEDPQIHGDKNISVKIGGVDDGSGEVEMTWGDFTLNTPGQQTIEQALNVINANLNFKIFDEHGLQIDTNVVTGLYKILFREEGTENLLRFNNEQNAIINFNSTYSDEKTTTLVVEVKENIADGETVASERFNFTIKSVGVTKVEKEIGETVIQSDMNKDENYEDNLDTTQVTIRKYLNPGTGGDVLDLTKLIRVYLGDNENYYSSEDIKVRLNETFVNRLEESLSKDLAAMLHFEGFTDADQDTMKDYMQADRDLTKLSVRFPFKEDTTLEFVVTDKDSSRFYISLNLVIVRQTSITIGIDAFNEQKGYDEFLVKLGSTTPALFADETYDLDKLLLFSGGKDYSWATGLAGEGLLVDHTVSDQSQSLLKITEDKKLQISKVDHFEIVTFTLYYGINSSFALNTGAIDLYINPNIVIVEKNVAQEGARPFINLNEISDAALLKNFGFYKATSYVDKVVVGKNRSDTLVGNDLIQPSSFKFQNNTPQKDGLDAQYIDIDNVSGEYVYLFRTSAPELELRLGQNVDQTFSISTVTNENVNAVRVQEFANGSRKIILCVDEKNVAKNVEIGIEIGFGQDEFETIKGMLYREKGGDASETVPVQIVKMKVTENGKQVWKTFVVFAQQETYLIGSDYAYANCTGQLSHTKGQEIYSGTRSEYFNSDNTLTITASPQDKNGKSLKTLSLTLNVIVSRIGEKFVYYKNAASAETPNFNVFGEGEEDFLTLIKNPAAVGAFQALKAGNTYKLFHALDINAGTDDDSTSENGIFGFYFDTRKANAGEGMGRQATFEAYQMVGGQKISLNWSELCTLTADGTGLTFNHILDKYENTYIEITLPFKEAGYTFSFKYRIKILPDFEAGSVNYPFADDVEHLDNLADPYVEPGAYGFGKYEIDLNEKFDATNSKASQIGKARFVDPHAIDPEFAEELSGKFAIVSARANGTMIQNLENNEYFEYDKDALENQSKLIVTLKQAGVKLSIILKKSFKADDLGIFGADLQYELRFNMGTEYKTDVKKNGSSLENENKIYHDTISAGAGEQRYEVSIGTGDSTATTPEKNFDFLIKAKEGTIEKALQKTLYLKAGTIVHSSEDESEFELTEDYYFNEHIADDEDDIWYETNKPNSLPTITIDGKQYTASIADATECFAYLSQNGNSKILHVNPCDNVENNHVIEFGIYTAERVALKLELVVKGFYEADLNTKFDGGKTYSYLSSTGIFTKFVDTSGEAEQGIGDTSDTYTYSLQIEKVDTDTVTIQDREVAKTALVDIKEDPADWKNNTIEFAHLPQEVAFNFSATVTRTETRAGNSTSYTFNFEITVGQSANIDQVYTVEIGNVYGGADYLLCLGSSATDAPEETFVATHSGLISNAKLPSIEGSTGEYLFEATGEESGEQDYAILTPEFVGRTTLISWDYTIKYVFGTYYLEYTLRVTYTTLPSINVDLHTPAPDGKTYSSAEYLDTTNATGKAERSVENFFGTAADFAMKVGGDEQVRVTAKNVDALKDVKIAQNWSVSVTTIDNVVLQVNYGDDRVGKTITSESADKQLLADEAYVQTNLTFTIQDASKDGTVEFSIVVSGSRAVLGKEASNYVVQVLRSGVSAVSIVKNSTNYDNDQETIYAEDLAKYSDPHLFAEDRIVQFDAKTAGTYHLKFTKGETEKHIEVTADKPNTITNVDVGESLTDYDFDSAYESYDSTGFRGELDEETIFNSMPVITSRLVAIYAQNTENEAKIELGTEKKFMLKKSGDAAAKEVSEVALTPNDLDTPASYDITLQNGTQTISTSGKYTLLLKIDFEIQNNANQANGAFKKELIAGTSYTLLGNAGSGTLNNELHIRSPRQNKDYTLEMMQAGSGNLNLQFYGFDDVPILAKNADGSYVGVPGGNNVGKATESMSTKEKDLAVVAGTIHEKLQTDDVTLSNGNIIKYFTGLTPRAKASDGKDFTVNSANTGFNTYNYVVLQGQVVDGSGQVTQNEGAGSGRGVDYTLVAQGCNNDGNHVMIRVVYSVNMGDGQTVPVYNNLLFKVVPNTMMNNASSNSNTTGISFKQNHRVDGGFVDANTNRTFGGEQTIANNYSVPYVISNEQIATNSASFNLFNTNNNAAGFSQGVIQANMYGEKTNAASKFKFTYTNISQKVATDGETKICNDFVGALTTFDPDTTPTSKTWTKRDNVYTGNGDGKASALSVGLSTNKKVSLGEKWYYIDFVNDFGYAGRFFFKIVATDNPIINSMSDPTYKEDDTIAVGAQYKDMTITKTKDGTEDYYQYTEFEYDTASEPTYNELKFSTTPTKVKLLAKLTEPVDGVTDIFKTVEIKDPKQTTITIFGTDDGTKEKTTWKKMVDGAESNVNDLGQSSFKGATITILAQYDTTGATNPFDATVIYGKNVGGSFTDYRNDTKFAEGGQTKPDPITILSSENTIYTQPTFEEKKEGEQGTTPSTSGNKSFHTVTLTNISAYAFEKGAPVDQTTAQGHTSRVNEIKVERIDFYNAGTWVGGSYGKNKTFDKEDQNVQITPQQLITSGEKYFYASQETAAAGKGPDENICYTVPIIEPRAFGNQKQLQVTMNITLVDGAQNKAVLSRQVTIVREDVDLFGAGGKDKEILDGQSPTVTNTDVTSVLNDTLEVTLKQDQSTTFFVTDRPINSISSQDGKYVVKHYMYDYNEAGTWEKGYYDEKNAWKKEDKEVELQITPITITNEADYTQTYYYSITDNLIDIANRKSNFQVNEKFYIYEFNFLQENEDGEEVLQTSNAVFAYNGKTSTSTSNKLNVNTLEENELTEEEQQTVTFEIKPATEQFNQIGTYSYSSTNPPTTISVNNALRLYIPSVNALGDSDHTMSRTLNFLYIKDNKSYQYAQTFKIKPYYTSLGKEGSTDSNIQVSNYIEVSKTVDSKVTEKFYYIPLSGWAGDASLKLTDGLGSADKKSLGVSKGESPYKFTFSISNETPSGSAFVDEFGTLTTSQDFTISGHTIILNVYMNVSGYENNFEERNNSLEIGKFTLRLNAKTNSTTSTDGRYTSTTAGQEGFVNIPTGFKSSSTSPMTTKYTEQEKEVGTYACEVGTTIDFRELLKDLQTVGNDDLSTWSNKNYHVLKEGEKDIYCRDNMNTWTFDIVGQKTVTILVTGRSKGGYQFALLELTMHVFGRDTRTQPRVAVDLNKGDSADVDLAKTFKETGTGTWFELNKATGMTEKLDNNKITLNKEEENSEFIQEKTLILSSGGTYKLFEVTFFLYNYSGAPAEKSINVALTRGSAYTLQNAVSSILGEDKKDGETYHFFELGGNDVSQEQTVYHSNSTTKVHYLLTTHDANGKTTAIHQVSIQFCVTSASADKTAGVFADKKQDAGKTYIDSSVIQDKVKDMFEIGDGVNYQTEIPGSGAFFTIFTRDANGVLTAIDGDQIEVSAEKLRDETTYVVAYRETGGTIVIKTAKILAYYYEQAIDVTIDELDEQIPFSLYEISDKVLDAINTTLGLKDKEGELKGALTYSYINESNGTLETINEIPKLEETGVEEQPDFEGTFYVEISGRTFLINLKLNVKPAAAQP